VGRAVRFATVALAGSVALTACQGNSGTSSTPSASTTDTSPHPTATGSPTSSGPLTTRAAQSAVEGRDYTTLYTVDPHGSSGARVGVRAVRDDGSAVIVNDPPGAGDLIAQSQVGIQTLQSDPRRRQRSHRQRPA